MNTAYLVTPKGRIAGAYHKRKLIPFMEYLPLRGVAPWPQRLESAAGNFVPGTEPAPLELNDLRFAVQICWESVFASAFRAQARTGAQFAVNIGNEAWFGESTAGRQFLAANVFRAVEQRLAIARSVNTGISGFIDPYGRIVDTVRAGERELFVEGFRTHELPVIAERTLYFQYGDLFAYLNVAIALVLCTLAAMRAVCANRRIPPPS